MNPKYPGQPGYADYLRSMPDKYRLLTYLQDLSDQRTKRRNVFISLRKAYEQSERTRRAYHASLEAERFIDVDDEEVD